MRRWSTGAQVALIIGIVVTVIALAGLGAWIYAFNRGLNWAEKDIDDAKNLGG